MGLVQTPLGALYLIHAKLESKLFDYKAIKMHTLFCATRLLITTS